MTEHATRRTTNDAQRIIPAVGDGEPPRRDRVSDALYFEHLVYLALSEIGPVVKNDLDGADFMVRDGDRIFEVEAKVATPATHRRVQELIELASGRIVPLALAVPGILTAAYADLLSEHKIRVFDGPALRRLAPTLSWPDWVAGEEPAGNTEALDALERLRAMPAGRQHWAAYQKLIGDILGIVLVPPLSKVLIEHATRNKVNRRDFVMPNRAESGHWAYLRTLYRADYVVADAKNYSGKIEKPAVLQVANYLSDHGPGLFGIIVSRVGFGRAAQIISAEQWILHRKIVLSLDDDDVAQMLTSFAFGGDSTEVVLQKIDDFRLGM